MADKADFLVDGVKVRTCLRPPGYPMQLMLAVFDFPEKSDGTDTGQIRDHVRVSSADSGQASMERLSGQLTAVADLSKTVMALDCPAGRRAVRPHGAPLCSPRSMSCSPTATRLWTTHR